MTTELFYFVDIVLLSRLMLLFEDCPQRTRVLVAVVLIQTLGIAMVFPWQGKVGVLLIWIIGINCVFGLLERKYHQWRDILRISSLFALLFVANVFFSPAIHLQFNTMVVEKVRAGTQYLLWLHAVTDGKLLHAGLLLAGWLFVLNEANIIVRVILMWVRIGPPAEPQDDSSSPLADDKPVLVPDGVIVASSDAKQELNTGRIIGILERTIMYVLVLLNHFTAIAFVLTAKSFARHKALDNRAFAEYVLVGTLLSSSIAIFTGMFIRWLLE